jgi:hypothetical protein
MATGALFCWGFLGGFIAAATVYVIPEVMHATWSGKTYVTRGRVIAFAVLLGFLAATAGTIALIPDHLTRGQAISVGFASQTIVKGLISGALDAVPNYNVLPRGPTTAT